MITLFCTVPFIVKSPNIIRIIAYLILIVFLFYIIISIIQNFWTLYNCIIACRELVTENKKKNEKKNEIFLEDEKNINCNNSYN